MPIERLRRDVAPLVDAFTLPSPWNLASFVRSVGQERGRPILLLPTDTAGSMCGLWVATDHADYIAYEQSTSGFHRDHIVLHELGHIILGHHGRSLERVGDRARYPDRQEQQAEVFGSLVLQRAGRKTPPPPRPEVAAVLATFDAIGADARAPHAPHPGAVRRHGLRHLGVVTRPG